MNTNLLVILGFFGVALGHIIYEPAIQGSSFVDIDDNSCIPIRNISRPIPGVPRKFFGKVDIQTESALRVNFTLPAKYTHANISLDTDVENKNTAIGLTFTQAGHALFIKVANRVTILRRGTLAFRAGSTHSMKITAKETGPGWNKYAFLVDMDGKFFCYFEEQVGLEVIMTNYISAIQDINVTSVELCAAH